MFFGLGGHEGYINITQIERITEKETTGTFEGETFTCISYILKFQSGNEIEVSKDVVNEIIKAYPYEW